jgi:hypothetical protein
MNEIPLMFDSDDADSLLSSLSTMITHDEVRTAFDIADLNPDEINLDLYEEEEVEEEPPTPKKQATQRAIKQSKASTVEELEDELVESVCDVNGSVFSTLYLLHEHFAKSKTATKNEKMVMKGRIINKLSEKISSQKLSEFSTILNNFFN